MKNFLTRFNWIQFLAVAALVAAGTVAIWSAGSARAETVFREMWKANLQTAACGFVLYFALAALDYRRFVPVLAGPLYLGALAMLVLVLLVGTDHFGGRRWLWFFQPSEISKLCVLMAVAAVFGRTDPPGWLTGLRGFCLAVALVALPVGLILLEPDLGTALTLVPACILMLFLAGVWRRGLVTIIGLALAGALAVLGAVGEAERPGTPPERREAILRCVPLREHQVKRVKTFLYPDENRLGAGYNYRQAMIAIGSGGVTGKGLGKGEANHLKYLPPKVSMNDFIFCVWAEELGFAGTASLVAAFGVLVLAGLWTALGADEPMGRLLALGVSSLVFAHAFINIAMSVGMVPITGLPLPFISSGRTFLVTAMAGLGLVQSISIHGRKQLKNGNPD